MTDLTLSDLHAPRSIQVADRVEHTCVLGPGCRAGVWCQGCPLRCPGCISPAFLPFAGGEQWLVTDLADWLVALPDIDGATFSGGEPFAQAGALAALIDEVRSRRDLSMMAYSGFTIEHLRRAGDADQRRLLERLDLLVDGPYVESQHGSLRWRGSANQRLHILTDRHADLAGQTDETAGLEASVRQDGSFGVIGVPPVPHFTTLLADRLGAAGIHTDLIPAEDTP